MRNLTDKAKRQITDIDPDEVSLVDIPAILEGFTVVKNLDDDGEEKGKEAPAGADALAAIMSDMQSAIETKMIDLADVKKSLEALQTKVDEDDAEDTPTGDAPEAGQVDVNDIVAQVTKAMNAQLVAAGVLEAPKSPAEQLADKVEELEGAIRKSFKQVVQVQAAFAEELKKMRGDGDDAPAGGGDDTPVSKQDTKTDDAPAGDLGEMAKNLGNLDGVPGNAEGGDSQFLSSVFMNVLARDGVVGDQPSN